MVLVLCYGSVVVIQKIARPCRVLLVSHGCWKQGDITGIVHLDLDRGRATAIDISSSVLANQ